MAYRSLDDRVVESPPCSRVEIVLSSCFFVCDESLVDLEVTGGLSSDEKRGERAISA
jgi:hypothetical protein